MKKILPVILVLILLVSLVSIDASAACVHTWGATYSEAAHPHAYYHQCTKCGLVQYTGGYATKAHGNGAWGSGTCPSCGSHSFYGTSCTTSGSCACGATQPPYGHGIGGTEWCDAYHTPGAGHANYRNCVRCGVAVYNGTYTTKTHGNGAYGSGTCPSCGTHTYGSITNEAAHPHAEYRQCTGCGTKSYTGTYATRSHSACASCGTHGYFTPDVAAFSVHPHPVRYLCDCGAVNQLQDSSIVAACPTCSANSKIVTTTVDDTMIFSYIDEGLVSFPVQVHAVYSEQYKKDGTTFISFYRQHEGSYEPPAGWLPDIWLVANHEVTYRNTSGSTIYTGDVGTAPFRINSVPSFSRTDLSGMVEGSGMLRILYYDTNYTY